MSTHPTITCPGPYPKGMCKDDIEDAEHIYGYAFVNGLPRTAIDVPSWSKYYDPEQRSDYEDEEDHYVPPPSNKKDSQRVQAKTPKHRNASNRFAVLAKVPAKMTTPTKRK